MASKTTFRRAGIGAALLFAAIVAALRTNPAGSALAVADLGAAVAAALGGAAAFYSARGRSGRRAVGWRLIGSGLLVWSAAELVWSWYELVLHQETPFPSFADVGYLAAVVPLLAGILLLIELPSRTVTRVRFVLDGLIVIGALGFVSWSLVLHPVLNMSQGSPTEVFVGLAYPISDVLIAAIAFTMLSHAAPGSRRVPALLAVGFLLVCVADSAFAVQVIEETYASGGIIDLAWIGGYLVVGLAALVPGAADRTPPQEASSSTASVLMPYIPVVLAGATCLFNMLDGQPFERVELVLICCLLTLLMARQLITLLDNVWLTRGLARREEHFRSIVQGSSDCVTVCDNHGIVTFLSPSAERIFGWLPSERLGRTIDDLVHPDDRVRLFEEFRAAIASGADTTTIECRLRHKNGEWVDVETKVSNQLENPAVRGVVLNGRDISERKALESKLTHQAFHDSLTGLANRELFRDRVQHALERHSRESQPVAVLFLDLDGFKHANDTLGHRAGDQLLLETSTRLRECVRPGDTVARLGGDEFAVLFEDAEYRDACRLVAERFLEVLHLPFEVIGHEVFVSASIGIAVQSPGDTADDLLRNADLAMYRAKVLGKGRCEVFEPSMHQAALERVAVENDLRHALERQELVLHYQPIYDLSSAMCVGVEALVRWEHPERGLVYPGEFITIAEESGLIVPIGRWVLEEACRQLRRWMNAGSPRVHVSVNLSARQLSAPRTAEHVARTLRTTGLEPSQLILEITETMLVEDTERTIAKLHLLRELGVRLAIDDFGTGYSSLSYLRRLPVDVIKMDRTFVCGIGQEGDLTALSSAIVDLGRSLGLDCVAEGIEEVGQLEGLVAMGCTYGQGYLFARPMPADQVAPLLQGKPLTADDLTGLIQPS